MESVYAIITKESYESDVTAQSLGLSPRAFVYQDVEMVILSLEQSMVDILIAYIKSIGSDVEYELTVGSNKVTLLNHSQAIELFRSLEEE